MKRSAGVPGRRASAVWTDGVVVSSATPPVPGPSAPAPRAGGIAAVAAPAVTSPAVPSPAVGSPVSAPAAAGWPGGALSSPQPADGTTWPVPTRPRRALPEPPDEPPPPGPSASPSLPTPAPATETWRGHGVVSGRTTTTGPVPRPSGSAMPWRRRGSGSFPKHGPAADPHS